jgi:hypothetical protein
MKSKAYLHASLLLLAILISSCTRNDRTVTISWTAPDRYTNNTPLTDLAGYRIFIGTTPGSYEQTIDIPINETRATMRHTLKNLPSGHTYFIAVKAYNKSGIESNYSNEVNKYIK